MLTVLKAISGSLDLLALACAIGLAIRAVGYRRIAHGWLFGTYLVFVIGGLPVVARAIASAIPTAQPASDVAPFANTDILVVLDGDNSLGRIREAAAILRTANPRMVVVSGRRLFVDQIAAGVPANWLIVDTSAATTRDQISLVGQLVRQQHARAPTLIVSCLSVARVEALLRSDQLRIRVAAADFDETVPAHGYRKWMPTVQALDVSRDSLYEIVALRYYRSEGWIG